VRIGFPLQPFNAWPLHESFRHRLAEPFTFGFVNPRGPFFSRYCRSSLVKLPDAINCFFALLLFSAAPKAFGDLAQEPAGSVTRSSENQLKMQTKKLGLVIHGGAGTIDRSKMTPEDEREYRAGLENALRAGWEVLQKGGSSLDAVEAAVRVLEDDPHFNAGRGAVFTNAGTNELDAAIMDGKTLMAGSVAGVKLVKNPITLARLVMEKSPHVTMMGEGAEAFAKEHGTKLLPDQKYFFNQRRWDELQNEIKAAKTKGATGEKRFIISQEKLHGTVGAVALDRNGNLAAATSTGGKTNKLPGRVGDTPVIGAGCYANNKSCAVSGTGDGELFIMTVAAHDVSALVEYGGKSVREATQIVLDKIAELGGTGGLIAIDRQGNIALPFNTSGMYRGYVDPNGKFVVEIYK
jgi:beta-aspartyl-peptidase (threonine type)